MAINAPHNDPANEGDRATDEERIKLYMDKALKDCGERARKHGMNEGAKVVKLPLKPDPFFHDIQVKWLLYIDARYVATFDDVNDASYVASLLNMQFFADKKDEDKKLSDVTNS